MKDAGRRVQAAYELARERYAAIGVDTDNLLKTLDEIPISIQCWQGDDVRGFENPAGELTGGIQTSGNYPGRARNADELRSDLEAAFAQIPGRKRVNLHAIYLESNAPVERDAIGPQHFKKWVEWAKARDLGLDFNPTCFSHRHSDQNLTLSHPDLAICRFWIDHCVASRRISEYFGKALGTPAVMNIWIPDGFKDKPADRFAPRRRLMDGWTRLHRNHWVSITRSPSKANSSVSARRAIRLVRTISILPMRPRGSGSCVLMRGTFIPPRMSRIESQRPCSIWARFCCTCRGRCGGIPITSFCSTMQRSGLPRRLFAAIRCPAYIWAWTSLTRASTAIIDLKRRVKMVIITHTNLPDITVNDPMVLKSMPASITASTGMDALMHAIETYVAIGAHPLTDPTALEAIRIITQWLLPACYNGNDVKACWMMAYGQFLAGMTFTSAGLGCVHSLAHQPGATHNVPHGVCNAILLPIVEEFNRPAAIECFADIAEAMGVDISSMSTERASKEAIRAIRTLSKRVKIPANFGSFGITRGDIAAWIEPAPADPCTLGNPRTLSRDDVRALYEPALWL